MYPVARLPLLRPVVADGTDVGGEAVGGRDRVQATFHGDDDASPEVGEVGSHQPSLLARTTTAHPARVPHLRCCDPELLMVAKRQI